MNIVSLSGGKDSTAMLIMMLEDDYKIEEIIFADTTVEFPEMYEYLKEVEKYINKPIKILKPKKSWDELFYTRFKSGKYKGNIYGFPTLKFKWCNMRLKLDTLNRYYNSLNENDIMWLGLAFNETQRYKTLKKYNNKRSYLYENQITEKECDRYLREIGLLNPLYDRFLRTGCYLCPFQPKNSLKKLRNKYPLLWRKLLDYDADSITKFRTSGQTVRELDDEFSLFDNQLSLDELISEGISG
jgi:3'-phosphoadenosine 5'-phosphosulfate sulfotransferase (PAPS reductase)/FAD synthetase